MKIGPYKVAYWSPSEPEILYSKMFDDRDVAKSFGAGLEEEGYIHTLMKIRVIAHGHYTWEILEDGIGKHFPLLSKLYHYRSPLLIGAVVLALTR